MTTEEVRELTMAERLRDMADMVKKARLLADDGNWAECYADDVSYLLNLLHVSRNRRKGS